jgi:dihydrofolate reductase
MKPLKAIAAMSLNRVIGRDGKIPWHIPEELKWFKQITTGNVVLMGRKTFESLGRPLPNRINIVVTRRGEIPGVITISDLAAFDPAAYERDVFVIGGAEIYAQSLPRCSDLYLTVVRQTVEGDTVFPKFEAMFSHADTPLETPQFEVRHYTRR